MNVASWGRVLLVIVVGFVAQVALIDQLTLFGAHADLLVLLVAAAGLIGGPQRGATVGFVAGLFADLAVTTPFGLSPLCFVLVGYGVGLARAIPQGRDARSAEVATCVLAAVVATAAFALIGELVGQQGMLDAPAAIALGVVGLGGLVLAFPALVVMRWAIADSRPLSAFSVPSGGSALG